MNIWHFKTGYGSDKRLCASLLFGSVLLASNFMATHSNTEMFSKQLNNQQIPFLESYPQLLEKSMI